VVLVLVLGTVLLMVQARHLANKTGILEATLQNMTHGLVHVRRDRAIDDLQSAVSPKCTG